MSLNHRLQADEHYTRAVAAAAAGQWEAAAVALGQTLQLASDHLDARLLQAQVEQQRGRPRAALAALDSLCLHQPEAEKRPEVMCCRAQALVQDQKPDLALPLLEQLTTDYPDDVRPQRLLAQAYDLLGRAQDSATHWRHVLRLQPGNHSAARQLARLLETLDPQTGLEVLGQLPADPVLRLYAARQLQRLDRLRDAEEAYRLLLADHADDAGLWLEAADLAAGQGAHALALERCDHARRHDQRLTTACQRRSAELMTKAGRFTTAGRAWARLIPQPGATLTGWAGLLICALVEGRLNLARRAQRHLQSRCSNVERRALLCELWPMAAMGLVIKRSLRGSWPAATTPTGPLEELLAQAKAVFTQQVQDHPRRADAHYHLGVCARALGDHDAADQHALAALDINPNYRAARRLAEESTSRLLAS